MIGTWKIGQRMRRLKRELGRCFLHENQSKAKLPPRELQFAHLEPTGMYGRGRGLRGRYYDVLRNPDKYILACKHCHSVIDMTDVGRERLLTPEKRRSFLLTFEHARRIVHPSRSRAQDRPAEMAS